jgi:tetratricopeptide (TPR) repeat protein
VLGMEGRGGNAGLVATLVIVVGGIGYVSIVRPLQRARDAPAPLDSAAAIGTGVRDPAAAIAAAQRGFDAIRRANGDRSILAEANGAFADATRLDPESAQGWFGQGWALQLSGDLAGAESRYRRAALLAIDDPAWKDIDYFTHFNLGVLYRDQGRQTLALAAYQRAADLRPDDANAWSGVGTALIALTQSGATMPALERLNPALAKQVAAARSCGPR